MDGLKKIYGDLPEVPCIAGCTGCCVSPTMTLVEFGFLMKSVFAEKLLQDIILLVKKPMEIHPWFEGNYYCRFQQKNGFCDVHSARALACRLHGLPVIEKLGIDNLENCTIMDKKFLPDVKTIQTRTWLNALLEENEKLDPGYQAHVYGLLAFNIECWLDLLFQSGVTNEMFQKLQNLLRRQLPDWSSIDLDYSPHTELSDLMEAISLLDLLIKSDDSEGALVQLKKIRKGFPTTGTYFKNEASWMEKQIRDKVQNA